MYINCKLLLTLLLFVNLINGQKSEILTDSVFADNMYFKICELKIHSKSKHLLDIYKIIQGSFDVGDKPLIGLPEERLKAKTDTLRYYFKTYELNQINYSFEDYEIFLEKNDIINFSINETSYHSPWEAWKFYLLDLATGKKIQSNLFINPNSVIRMCRAKLKKDGYNLRIGIKDLINFQSIVKENKIIGLNIIFLDPTYTNHGYDYINVHFDWKELEKFISPNFKNRLK